MAYNITTSMHVDADLDQLSLQIDDRTINRMSLPLNNTGLANDDHKDQDSKIERAIENIY